MKAELAKQSSNSAWYTIQIYFNTLNHALIATVVCYMSYICWQGGNRPLTWHIWLCSMGYQLLMTEAIMSIYAQNVWSQHHSHYTKRTLHWVLQAIGSSMAFAGITILYLNRSTHFKSKHSIVGLTAAIFALVGMVNGTSALWSFQLRKHVPPVFLKSFHILTGLTAFVLGMIALFFAYDMKFLLANSREDIRMWLQAIAVISIILTLIGALRSLKTYTKSILR